jgi:hypothetical protein
MTQWIYWPVGYENFSKLTKYIKQSMWSKCSENCAFGAHIEYVPGLGPWTYFVILRETIKVTSLM